MVKSESAGVMSLSRYYLALVPRIAGACSIVLYVTSVYVLL